MTRVVNSTPALWEYTTTNTETNLNSEVDCVVVVAVLKRKLMFDCLLLLKQYRPTLRAHTLEFPVGFVNNNESPGEAALRSVQETTGFHGTVTRIGDVTALDAGASNFKVRLVSLEIVASEEVNKNVKLHHQEGVELEVVPLPIAELHARLQDYVHEGVIIDSRVEMYAFGLGTSKKSITRTNPANC